MTVEVDIDVDDARDLLCIGIRARNLILRGLEEQNAGNVGQGFGWLDHVLTELYGALPGSVTRGITGNEVNKPPD